MILSVHKMNIYYYARTVYYYILEKRVTLFWFYIYSYFTLLHCEAKYFNLLMENEN